MGSLVLVFRALADETRLRVLNLLLSTGELCVDDMVQVLGESQPKVSRHLAYLRNAELVRDRKDGLWVHYRITDSAQFPFELLRAALDDGSLLEQDLRALTSLQSRHATPVAPVPEAEPRSRTELEIELL